MRGQLVKRIIASEYGIAATLLALCIYFSLVTVTEQMPRGRQGGEQLAREITGRFPVGAAILIVTGEGPEESSFSHSLESMLVKNSLNVVGVAAGTPSTVRESLERMTVGGTHVDVIACDATANSWSLF